MISQRAKWIFRASAISAITTLGLWSCNPVSDPAPSVLSSADTARIDAEVRQALDDYAAAVVAGDREKKEAFWGDFDDFIHAGDGRVFGYREAWIAWMAANNPDTTLSWKFWDIHVAVLGPEAASYTANFEVTSMTDGEESTGTGSWTWVLRKTDEGWRVVHSNGKHNGFSYYEPSG